MTWRDAGISGALIGLGLLAFVWVKVQHPIQGLGNHDVAGIAYEADVILAGGLPYVDTVELKSPLPFFLVAAAWSVFGRSAEVLHAACRVWILLGAAGIAFGAWWLEADATRAVRVRMAGLAVALYLAESGPFESNYTTWLMPPYAWAFAFAIAGLRTGRLRWHFLAGIACTLAYLGKQHAIVIGAAIPVAWAWARWRGDDRLASGSAWLAWVGGAAIGAVPLCALYAARGSLTALVQGVLPIGQAAVYSQRQIAATPSQIAWGVIQNQVDYLGLAFAAAVCALALILAHTLARTPRAGSPETRFDGVLVAFWVLSIVGGGLGGMRYYKHYAPQYLPAMVWLAASSLPWRLAFASPRPAARWVHQGLLGLAAVCVMGVAGDRFSRGTYPSTFRPGRSTVDAGRYIAEHTRPDERVQVFGIVAWPVYFWSHRLAPGRLYKSLGSITDFNRNGLFEPPIAKRDRVLEFRPGPLADELYQVFVDHPPAFVVRARPFFPGYVNDPIHDFTRLQTLLDRDYVLVKRFDKLDVYELGTHPVSR